MIGVLLLCITVYSRLLTPGLSDAEFQALGQRAGYYIAPTAGAR